ncbi:CitMHS family transporter [Salinicoccus hispanicus]|uniref:TRAP transporter large permease subunit n=1 Tax=Salinicoccus hispanicus TaxID=157225 RepID=A0A6N8U192_9STAP|nr:citrate:proton symporter [Salinicoccus hispanicus]MXQ51513.1 TRAP transporter large permease subunit [Salinicoccus hispanicus]
MLSIVGLFVISTIVVLLITQKLNPIVALVIVPFIGALIAGFGFGEISEFFNDGISSVLSVVIMFIFAILFFGIMQDVGLFNPLIDRMVKLSGGNVILVAMATVVIGVVAHLDGSGASTFLITIPALLPLYRKLNMSPYLLVMLIGLSASIINMVPWGGPLGRTAAVLGVDASELWQPLIPLQGVLIISLILVGALLGYLEKMRIKRKGLLTNPENVESFGIGVSQDDESEELKRPGLLWLNFLLTLVVVGFLMWGVLPAGMVFMLAVSIALPLNFRSTDLQMKRIKAHAPNALMMAAIILAAGSFLGILSNTGMLDSLAEDIIYILPAFMVPYLHYIVGFFGAPMEIFLNTDAYYFALLPVVEQIVTSYGVDSIRAAYAIMIGNVIGTFISPFSPALWLAVGLAGIEMGRYIRYAFFWVWGFSLIAMGAAFLMGII